MLSVILTILKIIGIILLVLIGILVLLILLVLLVPLRYKASVIRKQSPKSQGLKPPSKLPQAHACITWLLKAAGVYVDFTDGTLEIRICIFRFCLKKITKQLIGKKNSGTNAAEPDAETADKDTAGADTGSIAAEASVEDVPADEAAVQDSTVKDAAVEDTAVKDAAVEDTAVKDAAVKDTAVKAATSDGQTAVSVKQTDAGVTADQQESAKPQKKKKAKQKTGKVHKGSGKEDNTQKPAKSLKKESALGRLAAFLHRIPEMIADVLIFLLELPSDVDDAADKVRTRLEPLLKKADTFLSVRSRQVYRSALRKLLKMLAHWRIRRIDGTLRFGVGKPDLTGKLTGLIYVLLPGAKGNFNVEPEFTEKICETDITLKGHIRLNHAVHFGVSLLLDKEFRAFLRRVRGKQKKEKQRKAVTQDG